jgi:hypothetical protein
VEVPVLQVRVPVWHGLPSGVQAPPLLHEAQLPVLQTMPVPHDVPFGWLPDSTQTGAPVAHEVVPVLHAFAGWQLEPAAQLTQVPALQTLSVPQATPFASALPLSVQPMSGEQTVMPPWHGLAGTQADPAAHGEQAPF